VVREFLKEVIEKEGRIITFKLGERGVKVMSEFRDVHSELHEDIGTGVLASLVFSIFDEKKNTKNVARKQRHTFFVFFFS